MAGKSDGFCGHPENAEALRKVLNKSAEIGLMIEGQQTANIPSIAIDKQAQVAALRQRLCDLFTSLKYSSLDNSAIRRQIVSDVFGIATKHIPSGYNGSDLDSLAAWLWERGVRA